MRIFMSREGRGLVPADSACADALAKIKAGEVVSVEVKRPRNIRHHRMFWALMNLVWDNIDHERYPCVEDLVAAIKICAGLRTRIELPNGDIGFIPGSIAFHKMDQAEFGQFYERVCDIIARHFLPGIDVQSLRLEAEYMLGMRS